jgi:Tol biopolymer transport system component/tRNA A-37 threonylcarbamoyl transferase component Bud32
MTDVLSTLRAGLADRYRIDREVGAGGMATVYVAHDIRHDRRVALKVLKPELAAVLGAERFLSEIRTTANLQHPHILALFDSGKVEGTVFYVMPYVEGESLRDRLSREKQLPIDDALRIAREVGEALHHAHTHGVIHRDIKPENILLQSGHAMVADFGIALAAANTGGSRMTETGMSLGTPTYMSPEQAMGERSLDARTDVYALGCVLYEMLVGDAPFTGSTAQAIVAKVLTERPAPIIARRDRVPEHVEEAVLTALEKLPADRFASAAEFVNAIGSGDALTPTGTRARSAQRRAARAVLSPGVVARVAGIAAVALAAGWLWGRASAPETGAAPSRLAIVAGIGGSAFSGISRTVDISSDGQTIVYSTTDENGGTRVMVRRLDGRDAIELPNSSGVVHLRLSRDGTQLYGSLTGSTMSRVSLAGGTWVPVPSIEATSFLVPAANGVFYWTPQSSVNVPHRVDASGRDSVIAARGIAPTQELPDREHVLAINFGSASLSGDPVVFNARSGAVKQLFDGDIVELRYASGYLVYVRADNVMLAQRFDLRRLEVVGEPVELAADVQVSGVGFAQMSVSDNGTVVYLPGSVSELVRVNRNGNATAFVPELMRFHSPRYSPDGRQLLMDIVRADGRDVWLLGVQSGSLSRVTFAADGHDPVWTRDGRGLLFLAGSNERIDIHRTPLGTTARPAVWPTDAVLSYTGTPLANGDLLTTVPGQRGRGLDIVRLRPDGTLDSLVNTEADESYPVPSPDGRWLAFVSDQSGRYELYLRSLVGDDVQLQISTDGATEPVWARSGRELFYRRQHARGADMMVATLRFDPAPQVTASQRLFDVSAFTTGQPHANYDVSPDGQSFAFIRRSGADQVVVLQNVAELARRLERDARNR